MKSKILTAIVCIVLAISLGACSSDTKPFTAAYKIAMSTSTQTSKSIGQIYKITNGVNVVGDTIQAVNVYNGKITPNALSYTVTKFSIYSNFTEAGISKDELGASETALLTDETGQLKSSIKFVVAEITVKNLKAPSNMNITDFNFVYCNSSDMSEEADISRLPLPDYFSSSRNNSEKDYYSYDLAIGQSKNVKVGWYLDTEKYKESKVYLAFNLYQDEYRSFVKLGL